MKAAGMCLPRSGLHTGKSSWSKLTDNEPGVAYTAAGGSRSKLLMLSKEWPIPRW